MYDKQSQDRTDTHRSEREGRLYCYRAVADDGISSPVVGGQEGSLFWSKLPLSCLHPLHALLPITPLRASQIQPCSFLCGCETKNRKWGRAGDGKVVKIHVENKPNHMEPALSVISHHKRYGYPSWKRYGHSFQMDLNENVHVGNAGNGGWC